MFLLSDKWCQALRDQPETGMGYQVTRVTLKDGRVFKDVLIDGGYITKVGENRDIPFREDQIADILVTKPGG